MFSEELLLFDMSVVPELRVALSVVVFSGMDSRSLSFLLGPSESFDTFFVNERRTLPSRCMLLRPVERREALMLLLRTEERSIEGAWMHSKPLLVCLYCTCIRSKTRQISDLITEGGFDDVVETLQGG